MEQGWIKIHRKILENPISNKPNYFSMWVTLLLKANHKERKIMWNGKVLWIKEGQILTGRKELSKQTGVPEGSIDRILNFFENEHQIEQQKTTKFRLITVINWENYQGANNTLSNKRTTDEHTQECNNKKKNITANAVEEISEKKEYSQQDKIAEFKLSPRRDVRIATLYLVEKKMNLPTEAVFMKEFLRAMKEVKFLKDFDDETIWKGFKYCKEKYPEYWTIETIYKSITKNFK